MLTFQEKFNTRKVALKAKRFIDEFMQTLLAVLKLHNVAYVIEMIIRKFKAM